MPQVAALLVSHGANPHAATPWGSALSVADRKARARVFVLSFLYSALLLLCLLWEAKHGRLELPKASLF